MSYIHAEGFAGGGKTWPDRSNRKGYSIGICHNDNNEAEIISNATEVKARGAEVIGISYKNNQVFDSFCL